MIKYLRILFFFVLLIWTAGILIPCFGSLNPFLYLFSKQLFSTVCHQDPLRSFQCNNSYLFVCARCFGIYIGALISSAALIFSFRRVFKLKISYLMAAAIPMLFDVVLLTLNVYSYSFIISFVTGLLFGSTVFVYILSVIENSFLENKKGKV